MIRHGSPSGPTTFARVREVFSSRGFPRFFATRTVSQLGDGIFQLAAADILLFENPGPNPALTLTLISVVTLVPFSVVAPFVGVFIDRWERRRILQVVPIVRAALAAIVALGVSDGPWFYLLVLGVLSANRFFLATMSAVLPQLVPEDDLLVANSVSSTGGSVANVVGLGIGAGLASLIGGGRTAGVAAVGFAGGAWLASRLPVHRGMQPVTAPLLEEIRQVAGQMVEGIVRLRRSKRSVFALSAVAANQFLVGAMTSATAVYFIVTLDLGVGAVSSLLGVIASGIFLGVALVPGVARRVQVSERLIPLGFGVAAVAVLASGAALSRPAIVGGGMFVGIAYALIKIPADTIVQEEMPDRFRGRAFSSYDMLFNVSRVAGTALTALAVEAGATAATIVVATGGSYAASMLGFAVLGRRAARLRHAAAADAPDAHPVPPLPADAHAVPPPAPAEAETPPEPDAAPVAETLARAATAADLFPVGEMVTLRTYSGHRADVAPRAIVVGDREIPVETVEWRAVEERAGERRLVFVIRVAGVRIRLSASEESARWEVERVLAAK